MSKYLSDKGIVIESSRKKIRFYDPLGNTLEYPKRHSVEKDSIHYVNAKPCFLFCKDSGRLHSSVFDVSTNLTAELYIENILGKCRELEYLVSQLAYGSTYDEIQLKDFISFDSGRCHMIEDGHFSSKDYGKWMNVVKEKQPKMAKALVAHFDIRKLSELIRFGIAHTDHRLVSAAESMLEIIKDNELELAKGDTKEVKFRSHKIDAVGWSINDFVKALSSVLDGVSKLGYYCSRVSVNGTKKISKSIVTGLPKLKFGNINADAELAELYSELNHFIILRNELTHNQNISNRIPAFIGKKTPNVNHKDICYCEIVLWDMDERSFCCSNNVLGFFSQHRNAISKLHSFFVIAYKLIDRVIQLSIDYLKKIALENGFTEFAFPDLDSLNFKYSKIKL